MNRNETLILKSMMGGGAIALVIGIVLKKDKNTLLLLSSVGIIVGAVVSYFNVPEKGMANGFPHKPTAEYPATQPDQPLK